MKNRKLIFTLLSCSFVLGACQTTTDTSKETTTSETTTLETTTASQTTTAPKESSLTLHSFDEVLQAYAKVLAGGEPDGTTINRSALQAVPKGDVEPKFKGISYAFYDLNQDGTDELLIALKDSRNGYTLLDIYSNTGGSLAKLTNVSNQMEAIGNERTTLTLREDRSLLLSTPINQEFILFKLNKEGKELEEVSKTNNLEDVKKYPKEFNLQNLTWNALTKNTASSKSTSTSMDLDAIQNGDYSSIAGIWKNGKGQTLTFDKNGLVSTTEKLGKPKMDRGYLTVAVNTNTSGYSIIFLPAGTKFTMVPKEDPSDQTVNRIWAGQGSSGDPREFFYKVE